MEKPWAPVSMAKSWAQLSIDKPWAQVSSNSPQVILGPTLDYPRLIPKLSLNQHWTIRGWSMSYSWAISEPSRDHSWVIPEPTLDHIRIIHWVMSESTLERCWTNPGHPRIIHELSINHPCTVPGSSLSYVWTNSGPYQDHPSVIPKPTLDHSRIIPELPWAN